MPHAKGAKGATLVKAEPRGKPITENWLAGRMRRFGISSRTIRTGEHVAKGYERADFVEAFARFLGLDAGG